MKGAFLVLGLLAAAAGGASALQEPTGLVGSLPEVHRAEPGSQRSLICRWLGSSDADSQVRLWFACRP